jgi:hypothetical protein
MFYKNLVIWQTILIFFYIYFILSVENRHNYINYLEHFLTYLIFDLETIRN